jgi:hypothetical protein
MTHYLQGARKPAQAWATHGLAVKAAFSMGLHSTDRYESLSDHESEAQKRAWWGCVYLDRYGPRWRLFLAYGGNRMLSMTFGRPNMIPEDHIRVDLPEAFGDERPEAPNFNKLNALSLSLFRATL